MVAWGIRKELLPHQQRVVDELKELTDKREKLALFFQNPMFKSLPPDEQRGFRTLIDIMVQDECVLQERIDHFPGL
jgi:hypothetical protein